MEGCITPILVQQQECDDDDRENRRDNNTEISGGNVVDAVVDCDGRDERGQKGEGDESSSHSSSQSLSRVLREQYSISKIDFLLFDHAKHLYLRDLQNLERTKLIGKGSHVCADNVVFNRLDTYREHMRRLEQLRIVDDENDGGGCSGGGVVVTRLEEMNLEYSNNLKDGMGEFALCLSICFVLEVEI